MTGPMLRITFLAESKSSIFLRSASASILDLPFRYCPKAWVAIRRVCISYPWSSNFLRVRWRKSIADSIVFRSLVLSRLTPAVIVRMRKWCGAAALILRRAVLEAETVPVSRTQIRDNNSTEEIERKKDVRFGIDRLGGHVIWE